MSRRFDIVIPEYNELSRNGKTDFLDQLRYLDGLSEQIGEKNGNKVILVDDASKDDSWKTIKEYQTSKFDAYQMSINGQKIGAIKKGLEQSNAPYVLLTDFDSQIRNPESIPYSIDRLEREGAAGAALKVIPRQNNFWGMVQDYDYAMGRVIGGSFVQGQKKFEKQYDEKKGKDVLKRVPGPKRLRCVAGAGGIWKRDIVLNALDYHSGRHNGDDMETTAIVMNQGHDVIYDPQVVIETQVPESFYGLRQKLGLQEKNLTLHQQRRRWEQGALETFDKEKGYYGKQVAQTVKGNRFGAITAWEFYNWLSVPLALGLTASAAMDGDWQRPLTYYAMDAAFTGAVGIYGRNELKDKRELLLTPVMPAVRAAISFPAKVAAAKNFLRDKIKENSPDEHVTDYNSFTMSYR